MNEISLIISRLSDSFLLNCKIFVITLLFSLPLGLVITFGSMSRFYPLRWLVRTCLDNQGNSADAAAYSYIFRTGLLNLSFLARGLIRTVYSSKCSIYY